MSVRRDTVSFPGLNTNTCGTILELRKRYGPLKETCRRGHLQSVGQEDNLRCFSPCVRDQRKPNAGEENKKQAGKRGGKMEVSRRRLSRVAQEGK